MDKTQATPLRLTPTTRHRTRKHHIPRMTAATNFPPQPKWGYSDELRTILHDTESCKLCKRWLCHFITEVADGNDDLRNAHHVLDSVGTAQKEVDDV